MVRTKIIATIGPACDDRKKIEKLIKAGVNVFRLNVKHNTLDWHKIRLERIRQVAEKLGVPIGVMVDIKGPELRIGKLKKGRIDLKRGETVRLGPKGQIVFENLSVLRELKKGQRILLDDGRIELEVIEGREDRVKAKVVAGGPLSSHKGVNLPETELMLPTISDQDLEAIRIAKKFQVDFVALSFVREKNDIRILKRVLEKERVNALIIAKIETASAIENFEEILSETDGVMVARGDLGVELPMEEVPFWQKYIINRCLGASKPVITATEMLSSMMENPRPTRAEVSDIANSVYDYSDAVMLSAETAIGKYPVKAVLVMRKTCEFIEGKLEPKGSDFIVHEQAAAMVLAAFDLVKESELSQSFKAFVVLTEEGKTARLLSSLRPKLPVLAITPVKTVQCQLCLSFGVESFYFDYRKDEVGKVVKSTIEFLKKKEKLKTGDKIVMIYGDDWRFPGRTNLVRIQEV